MNPLDPFKTPYITRLSHETGWELLIVKRNIRFRRTFLNEHHGGDRDLALSYAMQYRDELLRRYDESPNKFRFWSCVVRNCGTPTTNVPNKTIPPLETSRKRLEEYRHVCARFPKGFRYRRKAFGFVLERTFKTLQEANDFAFMVDVLVCSSDTPRSSWLYLIEEHARDGLIPGVLCRLNVREEGCPTPVQVVNCGMELKSVYPVYKKEHFKIDDSPAKKLKKNLTNTKNNRKLTKQPIQNHVNTILNNYNSSVPSFVPSLSNPVLGGEASPSPSSIDGQLREEAQEGSCNPLRDDFDSNPNPSCTSPDSMSKYNINPRRMVRITKLEDGSVVASRGDNRVKGESVTITIGELNTCKTFAKARKFLLILANHLGVKSQASPYSIKIADLDSVFEFKSVIPLSEPTSVNVIDFIENA